MNLCKCGCGKEVTHERNKYIHGHHSFNVVFSAERKQKISQALTGIKRSQSFKDECRRRNLKENLSIELQKVRVDKSKEIWQRPEFIKKMTNENANAWEGGKYNWCHNKARDLYSTGVCFKCGITLEEYQIKMNNNHRLSMHCRNRNYNDFSEENWLELCEFGCHQYYEELDKNR